MNSKYTKFMYSDIYFKSINSIIKENVETKGVL